ncbi:MAG: hypothetical protein AAGI23_19150 [Bacteroidota bacterium]
MMTKSYLFLFLFLISCFSLFSQEFASSKARVYESLSGEVYTLSLFINTPSSSWTLAEKEYYEQELSKAYNWLIDQAANYHQPLTFNTTHFTETNREVYIDCKRESRFYREISTASKALGHESIHDLLDAYGFDLNKKRFKLIFLVKDQGRSHAFNIFQSQAIDLAVVYCRKSYGLSTNHLVMAHEILHQFGAWDLYAEYKTQTPKRAQRARELYPFSVMANTCLHPDSLNVDELTAWRVGWHNNAKPEYMDFLPNYKRAGYTGRRYKGKNTITWDLNKKKVTPQQTNRIKVVLYEGYAVEDVIDEIEYRIEQKKAYDLNKYEFIMLVPNKSAIQPCKKKLKAALKELLILKNQYTITAVIG